MRQSRTEDERGYERDKPSCKFSEHSNTDEAGRPHLPMSGPHLKFLFHARPAECIQCRRDGYRRRSGENRIVHRRIAARTGVWYTHGRTAGRVRRTGGRGLIRRTSRSLRGGSAGRSRWDYRLRACDTRKSEGRY